MREIGTIGKKGDSFLHFSYTLSFLLGPRRCYRLFALQLLPRITLSLPPIETVSIGIRTRWTLQSPIPRLASSQHIRRNHDRGPLSIRNTASGLSGLLARQTGGTLSSPKDYPLCWLESTSCDGGDVRQTDFPGPLSLAPKKDASGSLTGPCSSSQVPSIMGWQSAALLLLR